MIMFTAVSPHQCITTTTTSIITIIAARPQLFHCIGKSCIITIDISSSSSIVINSTDHFIMTVICA